MLPSSNNLSADSNQNRLYQPLRKSKTPPSTDLSPNHHKPVSYSSLFLPSSIHHRSCLIIGILCLQFLLLILSHYIPFSLRHRGRISTLTESTTGTVSSDSPPLPIKVTPPGITDANSKIEPGSKCPFGKFFVYDLPPMLNVKIYENCDKLSPWGSRCSALSNNGFGQPATGLEKVIPKNLVHAWYWTDQFASEIIFHNRLLHHKCRTMEAESAAAYYVPFYAGLAVGKYLWSKYNPKDRDMHCEIMLDWLNHQPYFNRSSGWDHFMVMGRITWDFRRSKDGDWGSHCIYMPSMRNITRLLIERNPWDYFDVGVPYPTGFHPTTDADVRRWQEFVRSRDRKSLYCFAGATRGFIQNDFRGLLLSQCRNDSDACRLVDCAGTKCANGTSEILEAFLDSDFCLQPRGDSFTRRSIFDCMIAGSIPVFFWRRTAYYQYELFLPSEPESYSVFIHRNEVKNGTTLIRDVLERIGKEKVKMMREKVIELLPRIIYAKPFQGLDGLKDAADIALDGVMKRFETHGENGYRWK